MKLRSFGADNYRYGFNGMMKDSSFTKDNDAFAHYEFGARIYDSRVGRWLSVDPLRTGSPGITPFRFGLNNPLRFNDPNGKWEEDGHFWSVLAMGVAMGFKVEDALTIAKAAEYYDHIVHGNDIDNLKWEINGIGGYDQHNYEESGLGTWAVPFLQQYFHGLNGESSISVQLKAKKRIFKGNLKGFHLFGDAFAHAMESTGNKVMYGWNFYTFQHAITGGHEGKVADHIAVRGEQYMNYIHALNNLMASDEVLGGFDHDRAINVRPDLSIFQYISESGYSKQTNILLLKIFSKGEFNVNESSSIEFMTYNKRMRGMVEKYDNSRPEAVLGYIKQHILPRTGLKMHVSSEVVKNKDGSTLGKKYTVTFSEDDE